MKAIIYIAVILLTLPTVGQNLVPSDSWTVSSGSIGVFNQNGSSSMNIRELGMNPFGKQSILWKAVPDAGNEADGGWGTQDFSIDRNRMHRFAVWIKKTGSAEGTTYFGCKTDDILNLSGGANSNPYFWAGDLPILNKWYLLVGYVHAYNDPSTNNYGGIYDGETGIKISSITDFKFSPSSIYAVHRTYLYYDTNTSDRQYFYDPQVYALDGNLPVEETALADLKNGEVYFNKNVGIGTSTPTGLLEIKGPYNGNSQLIINTTNSGGELRFSDNDVPQGFVWYNQTNNYMAFGRGNASNSMFVNGSGDFGIGTTTPDSKLTVKGTIHTQEVKVDLNGSAAPDYVFEKDYPLFSLGELKTYIDQNKHLPEIPSATEMEMNGINLKEMNLLLLKKVEELTLYIIEQDKRLKKLENNN